jgi:hypothetical protein
MRPWERMRPRGKGTIEFVRWADAAGSKGRRWSGPSGVGASALEEAVGMTEEGGQMRRARQKSTASQPEGRVELVDTAPRTGMSVGSARVGDCV